MHLVRRGHDGGNRLRLCDTQESNEEIDDSIDSCDNAAGGILDP